MKKLKIYLDTSVLNFLWADDAPREKEATIKLFSEIRENKYEIFISAAVIEEIEAAPEPIKSRLENVVREYSFIILPMTEEIGSLARKYMEHQIIPERYGKDAYHIAAAVANNMDVIVSWNFKHIVNLRTHREVNAVNLLEGYREIEIRSPLEVIEYGN